MSVPQLSESITSRNLLCGIIRCAIQDYRALVRAGVVHNGVQIRSIKHGKWGVRDIRTDHAVRQLLHWWNEEYAEELVELGDLRISMMNIRERLDDV